MHKIIDRKTCVITMLDEHIAYMHTMHAYIVQLYMYDKHIP